MFSLKTPYYRTLLESIGIIGFAEEDLQSDKVNLDNLELQPLLVIPQSRSDDYTSLVFDVK